MRFPGWNPDPSGGQPLGNLIEEKKGGGDVYHLNRHPPSGSGGLYRVGRVIRPSTPPLDLRALPAERARSYRLVRWIRADKR